MSKEIKKIFTIILGGLGIMVLATPVLAATTLSLSPPSLDVTPGQSFDMVLIVDPEGTNNYTVKSQVQYPSDLLEVKSFTFVGDGWMSLSQPGYDLIDNTNGVLIKTAGFPGGFSESITFGSISFSAKKIGEGIIKIGEDSLVLDEKNKKNVLDDPLAQTVVIIRAAPVPPEEEVVPSEEEVPSPRPLFDILINPIVEQVQKGPTIFILVVTVIIILVIVAYVIYRKRKKKSVQ